MVLEKNGCTETYSCSPIISWVLCFCAEWSMLTRRGACNCNSCMTWSNLNVLKTPRSFPRRIESTLSEHIVLTSAWRSLPIFFRIYLLEMGSSKHWSTIAFLLPRAIHFPMCLLWGVEREYCFVDDWYPMSTCIAKLMALVFNHGDTKAVRIFWLRAQK